MFCKKVVVSAILTLLIVSGLFGLYSDDFILGSYTYLRGYSDETYFQYLSEANYNCLNASIIDESIQSLYQKSDDYNLDIILHDHIWQPGNGAVGVYYLTSSNNYYYEAEYSEIGETFPGEDLADKFYYRIHREEGLGDSFQDIENGASNDWVWQCLEGTHDPGVVCDTLFWKWQKLEDDEWVDKHVEKEILLPKQNSLFIMDTLYFEFQLKIDDLSHPDDTPICDFDFYISTKEGNHYIQNNLTLNSCSPFVYDNELSVGEYNNHDPYNPNYKTFSFYALVDEIDENLIFDYDSYHPLLRNINFKVYWHGNGNLYLDRFRIYDDIYRKLEEGIYDNMLITRVASLKTGAPNLKFLYSKDEPAQPQFDSYRLVEDILDGSQCDSLITAVNKKGCWYGVDNYFHHELFEYISEPEQIMFDMYPCASDTKWNCSPNITVYHIQDRIQNMMFWYKDIKEEICETENIDFFCIPQTQGVYYVEPGHFNNPDRHWGSMRPPSNMQKCLQFLPLCYGADGIVDYKLISHYNYGSRSEENNEPVEGDIDFMFEDSSRDVYHRLALIDKYGDVNSGTPIRTPQYYAIQEANHEISYLGPIVKSLEWVDAGTIDTNGNYLNSEFEPYYQNLEYISVSGDGFYSGFMECGEFVDTEGDPYFMFVNRRTDYSHEDYMSPGGYAVGIPKNTDIAFYDAEPQEIAFHFTDPMENYYLINQYTGGIYDITNSVSEAISIEPGDGMLLKLCQMPVPQEITGTTSVTNAYIPYSVTITSTGTLLIYDNVEFGPHATLTIEDGGLVIVWGNVLFGANSKIIVEGELQINPQNLLNTVLTSKINTWQGIECYEGGEIWVQNESIIEDAETGIFSDGGELHIIESTISNCDYAIVLYDNSSLEFDTSTINVPDNEIAVGISIVNNYNECDIQITGGPTLANSKIQGNGGGTGIFIASMINETEKKFAIENTTFNNLEEGIHIEGSEKTDDEILECTFNNCDTGIYLNGLGSMKYIRKCGFVSDSIGIQLNTFKVPIIHCGFISNVPTGCGIEFDYVSGVPIDWPDPGKASVDSCSFYGDITGIRCVNATPRVTNCAFTGTGIGIEIFNQSLIDMSRNSNNLFEKPIHIMFRDSGLINILNGHNDFWDVLFDFIFLGTYYPLNSTLNCNGNYWSDRPLDEWWPYDQYINMLIEPENLIIADYYRMDDYPNVPPGWDADNRYEEAGILEADGNPIEALALYTTILSEQLEEEKGFWMNCIDRTFNLSLQLNENLYSLVQFYDTFILNIPDFVPIEEREELICFVKNYQKKVYIEMESFQEAADIVIIRIEDPITPVDSLFAVMELESIYYLSSSGGGRSNVMTSYPQHEPEDCKQLQKWHEDHWNEISALLGIGEKIENEINQNIPLVPVLNGNYPNPFNPETKIAFSIPEDSKVNLTIYNIKGQKVKTLVNDQLEKGFHEIIWNSKDNNGKSVASGVYFYKFDVNSKTKGVKKMLLLK